MAPKRPGPSSAYLGSYKDKAREWYHKAVRWMDKNQPGNDELRRSSSRQLDLSQDRYGDLMAAMRRAEERMEPVLASMK